MGSLRDTMPATAALIDELRKRWSVEAVDALIRQAMRGQADQHGALYFAECGPDGQLHEFGCTRDGRHVVLDGGELAWVDAEGRRLPPPTPLAGPPGRGAARVIRASFAANANGASKGVVS